MHLVVANEANSATARVMVSRRAQLHVRLGLAAIIAAVFQTFTGIGPALLWIAISIALQTFEFAVFRRFDEDHPPGPRVEIAFYGMVLLSNIVFTSFGFVEAYLGGSWGIVCAGILWSGSIAGSAIVSGGSFVGVVCSLGPPLLAFFAMPALVIASGGSLTDGLSVLVGGLLNGFGTIAMWTVYQRLLRSATQAREASRTALLDSETGLPNRASVQQRLLDMQNDAKDGIVVVAAISIDRFQHLRGAIGHALMLDLTRRLAGRFSRAYDDVSIARLSSGTLGLAFNVWDMDEAYRVAGKLQAALATPVRLRDNRVDVSVTIGLSASTDAVQSTAELSLIDRAMIAAEQARTERRTVARFDAELYGNPGSTLSLMSEMLRAMENGQMSVSYQPKYALRSGEIVGAEALVRWSHPERGALRPDLFVQMAEETGHVAALTEWVLGRAVDDQRHLSAHGHDVCISVNWSGHLINDVAFTDLALRMTEGLAGKICLEVTETAIIGNPQLARQNLERFRAAGLTISIDDYGSGLSSLAYLKNIPADELKIDKAFVMNMAADPVDAVLVRSAVSLAHSLGLQVVAEGVENQGALELLRAMGCDLAQGYLIARPMPLADLLTYLGTRERMVG
jgi:predicted signal transduction protein with EAL and GGDEF domain